TRQLAHRCFLRALKASKDRPPGWINKCREGSIELPLIVHHIVNYQGSGLFSQLVRTLYRPVEDTGDRTGRQPVSAASSKEVGGRRPSHNEFLAVLIASDPLKSVASRRGRLTVASTSGRHHASATE